MHCGMGWWGEMHPRKCKASGGTPTWRGQLFTTKSVFGQLNMPQPSCSAIVSTLLPQLVLRKPLGAGCVCRGTRMLYAHSCPGTRWAPQEKQSYPVQIFLANLKQPSGFIPDKHTVLGARCSETELAILKHLFLCCHHAAPRCSSSVRPLLK